MMFLQVSLEMSIGAFQYVPFYIAHSILTAAFMHLLSAVSLHSKVGKQSIARFTICVEASEEMQ